MAFPEKLVNREPTTVSVKDVILAGAPDGGVAEGCQTGEIQSKTRTVRGGLTPERPVSTENTLDLEQENLCLR